MTVKDAAPKRREAEHALKQAGRAAKHGALQEAERWAKLARDLVASAEKLHALPGPQQSAEEIEAVRADLRRRLANYAAACQHNAAWDRQAIWHEIETARALAEGRAPPPPLGPPPVSDEMLAQVARGRLVL